MLVIELRFPYVYGKQLCNWVIYPALQLPASHLPITIWMLKRIIKSECFLPQGNVCVPLQRIWDSPLGTLVHSDCEHSSSLSSSVFAWPLSSRHYVFVGPSFIAASMEKNNYNASQARSGRACWDVTRRACWDVTHLLEFLPGEHKALGSITAPYKPSVVVHTWNLSFQEVDVGGPEVPLLHRKLEGSLGYQRACLKRKEGGRGWFNWLLLKAFVPMWFPGGFSQVLSFPQLSGTMKAVK